MKIKFRVLVGLVIVVALASGIVYYNNNSVVKDFGVEASKSQSEQVKVDKKMDENIDVNLKNDTHIENDFIECKNVQYNYKINIPADWKVWTRGYGDVRPATCEEGLSGTFFGKDLYKSMFVNQINIFVMNIENQPKGYWQNGINSLDDYLAQYPDRKIIEETTLDGERAFWYGQENDFKQLVSYYNHSIYEFDFYNVDSDVLNNFFNSFSFIR